MTRTMLALATLGALATTADHARADLVSERVVLVTGPATCGSNATGFKRVKHLPDGTTTVETNEFVVPYGSYLEITNVEYTLPYYTLWAGGYVQALDLSVKQRTGTGRWHVLSVRYNNRSVYAGDDNDGYANVDEVSTPGAQTHVVAYPVGPLMSSAARLCAQPTSNNFWVYGGTVRVRGRLVSSGDPVITSPSGEASTKSP